MVSAHPQLVLSSPPDSRVFLYQITHQAVVWEVSFHLLSLPNEDRILPPTGTWAVFGFLWLLQILNLETMGSP